MATPAPRGRLLPPTPRPRPSSTRAARRFGRRQRAPAQLDHLSPQPLIPRRRRHRALVRLAVITRHQAAQRLDAEVVGEKLADRVAEQLFVLPEPEVTWLCHRNLVR